MVCFLVVMHKNRQIIFRLISKCHSELVKKSQFESKVVSRSQKYIFLQLPCDCFDTLQRYHTYLYTYIYIIILCSGVAYNYICIVYYIYYVYYTV